MQVIDENEQGSQQAFDTECKRWEQGRRRGKITAGILLVIAGGIWLAKRTGADIPSWVLSWPMLLVCIGIVSLVKNGFRNFGWLILLGIGVVFLIERLYPDTSIRTWAWPVAIMLFGLAIIFKPRKRFNHHHWHRHWKHKEQWYEKKKDLYSQNYNGERIDVNAVFGSVRKSIISKNFIGGEINSVFGGSEINLSQADITGTVRMEVNQVFGSTTLIVPSHWKLHPELHSVLGGIEDKRNLNSGAVPDENKVLILEGNCVFGGIQIRNF
jgi:hypothetical protein